MFQSRLFIRVFAAVCLVLSSGSIDAADEPALVFLLGGQSNMNGFGNASGLDTPYDTPPSGVQIWRHTTGSYVDLRSGFGGSSGVSSGTSNHIGPELAFGYEIASRFSGRDIYLIKYSVGGTSLSDDWDPNGANNTLYDTFVQRVGSALADLDSSSVDYEIAGMLWMQGEQDSKSPGAASAYEQNLNEFVADMRCRYGSELNFVVGRLNDDLRLVTGGTARPEDNNIRFPYLDKVRASQVSAAENDPRMAYIDTDSFGINGDGVHFSQSGQLALGTAFAEKMHKLVAASDPPINIVLLLADDMGYADITAFGGRFGYTPNLDRLAGMGMVMHEFYAACAVCSPTRASILTGRYPLANGIDGHFPDRAGIYLCDQTRPDRGPGTLPGILRELGYVTLHMGKWHLGGVTLEELEHRASGEGEFVNSQGPHEHGFDEYYISQEDTSTGIRSGMIRSATLYRNGPKHLVHNDVYQHNPDEQRDWTAFKGDIATRYIAEQAEVSKPFFLNVWFDVPHTPYEDDHVPLAYHFDTLSQQNDDQLGRARHVLNDSLPGERIQENHRRFLSMVTYMDHQIGRILDAIEDPNGDGDTSDSIAERTLIIFASDNGGAWPADNGVFAGGKACVREGGIRVPMIAVLPGQIEPGARTSQLSNTIDLMPSFLAMAGLEKLPAGVEIDGIDLSPVWLGQTPAIDRGVMFSDLRINYKPQRIGPAPEPAGYLIARRGNLKLIFKGKGDVEPVALYDLSIDASEQRNLIDAPSQAATINELTQATHDWLQLMRAAEED